MGSGSVVRVALRPRWWAWHLALVAVLLAFGWLGWWQVGSFEDGAPGPAPRDRPVAAIDAVTAPGGRLDASDVGRPVRAAGRWEGDGQLLVPGRERGGRAGSLVVTPLRTAAGVLPVVRGWQPGSGDAPAPPTGTVRVTGVVQRSETEADATAAPGTLAEGRIPYVATVTLLDALPYRAGELYDGFVVLTGERPADADAPRTVEPAERSASAGGGVGRWRNLAYGLQWWLFAAAAVVFWASVLRRAAREQPRPPAPGGPDGPRAPLDARRRTT